MITLNRSEHPTYSFGLPSAESNNVSASQDNFPFDPMIIDKHSA